MTAGRKVYIIGFMGSGKTTAGRKIASTMGWQFKDLDLEIEHVCGKSIRDIFSEFGEERFREIESHTLKNLITYGDTIISAGGGTPCYLDNMDFMLETGQVVYLRMTTAQLKTRLEGGRAKRPLLKEKSGQELIEYITQKLAEREQFYLKAGIVADGFNLDIKTLCKNLQ
jgi:shikimate kinase